MFEKTPRTFVVSLLGWSSGCPVHGTTLTPRHTKSGRSSDHTELVSVCPKVRKMQRVLAQAKFMNPVFVQVCAEERLAGTSVTVWRKSMARRCTRSGQAVVLSKRLTGLLLHFDDGSRFFKGVTSEDKVHRCHLQLKTVHYFELCWLTDTRLFFLKKKCSFSGHRGSPVLLGSTPNAHCKAPCQDLRHTMTLVPGPTSCTSRNLSSVVSAGGKQNSKGFSSDMRRMCEQWLEGAGGTLWQKPRTPRTQTFPQLHDHLSLRPP